MATTQIFSGTFKLNGKEVTDSIRVYLTDYEITLGDGSRHMGARETLYLHPVSPKMFSHVADVEKMRSGLFYSITGTKLGALTYGPLGHPGDGEYDYRPISSFEVSGRFTSTELLVRFEGVTLTGHGGFREEMKTLESSEFYVEFRVPRSEMLVFLDMKISKYFEDRVDAC